MRCDVHNSGMAQRVEYDVSGGEMLCEFQIQTVRFDLRGSVRPATTNLLQLANCFQGSRLLEPINFSPAELNCESYH